MLLKLAKFSMLGGALAIVSGCVVPPTAQVVQPAQTAIPQPVQQTYVAPAAPQAAPQAVQQAAAPAAVPDPVVPAAAPPSPENLLIQVGIDPDEDDEDGGWGG